MIFEVKQNLCKENIAYAGEKAASVRRLRRTSAPIPTAGGSLKPRELFAIASGILASVSDWSPPLGERLTTALADLPIDEQIEFGCALKNGSFQVEYPESGAVVSKNLTNPLLSLVLGTISHLQTLGTVPAIDYDQYNPDRTS